MTLLRPAAADDASAIATILSDWIDETDWMPRVHTHAEDQEFGAFLIEKTDVTVATQNTDIIGFIALQRDEIQALYLAKPARGQGVGLTLLEHAKQNNKSLGLWAFQANSAARRFYRREGFHEVELTDGAGNDEKLPDVRLIWQKN